jgi:anaerobic magnesium-protoporphyrin IX monomethyl ester cyclase
MCSYVSPESLMPPLELISCGAVIREWHKAEVKLIDAIADQLPYDETLTTIQHFSPDLILTITGFECFEEDVDVIRQLKKDYPNALYVVFGHYATHFFEETLSHSGADVLILGEPELVLNDLLKAEWAATHELLDVNGIVYKKNGQILVQGSAGRIRDPNELPIPAYDLLPIGKYYEPLLARPYGMIQTVRGCPYKCNYCVKSYGTKLAQLTTDRVIEEVKQWIDLYQVKSIRFIDDTFTINRQRVIELSKAIIDNKIEIEWACLSRTDNLDEEVLSWMKKSGCKRIYFGMESGSQRMLDIFQKNVNVGEALASLHLCRKMGIETAAFFMSGHPAETEADFQETLAFAKAANLSYASFNPLTPYPGTGLFQEIKEQLDFSIYPYKNDWKDELVYQDFSRRKSVFYKGFYLRVQYFSANSITLLKNFSHIFSMGIGLLRYLWWDKRFVISGIKGARDK